MDFITLDSPWLQKDYSQKKIQSHHNTQETNSLAVKNKKAKQSMISFLMHHIGKLLKIQMLNTGKGTERLCL